MSGLSAEVIDKIRNLMPVKDRIIDINGRKHTFGKFEPLPEPSVDTMRFATLTGFCDFVKAKVEEQVDGGLMITVDSHTNVSLRSALCDPHWGSFENYAVANADNHTSHFGFGEKYDVEDFMIRLQTSFVDSEQRNNLIKVAGNMSSDSEHKMEDDGVTQSTTVGRAVKTKVHIQNPIKLRPYRTFHEDEQIESPFVFRIHPGERGYDGPALALYESDSGKWKLDAISAIAKWIGERVGDVPVYQ